ncbi:GNAT family N-acetyltransferase [Actinobacteria bacterium YIM 96077]|uniref:GNAT family N-acetyltransferase n=2 Tax=Phytoactinopolyspora halophila TaxID=1981511 RepID=A0A329QTG8_9ACTN|nr:GNAT family N-acetyltransferase [Actinobacteria bacterium YIM 96077]RAW14859.1 GNAT family N-acetyltransferase [Phytoactinopolyspora halophila]
MLESWQDGSLRVRPAGGDVLTVPDDDVIAVKAIPQRPVTKRDVRDLESAATRGWRALESEHLGGWLLRAADGFTRRANSCLVLDHPERPLDQAIAEVEDWYRQRNLSPAFQLCGQLGSELTPLLDARGWSRSEDVLVLTASNDDVRAGTRHELPAAQIAERPDEAWLRAYHYHGTPLPSHGLEVLTNADTVAFASVLEHDDTVAIARGVVTEAPSGRRWLGVSAVEVKPHARRRGLGSHVVAELAEWAAGHDVHDAYLQVVEDNTAAQAAYRKLGFGDHHTYHYRQAP